MIINDVEKHYIAATSFGVLKMTVLEDFVSVSGFLAYLGFSQPVLHNYMYGEGRNRFYVFEKYFFRSDDVLESL